MDAIYAVSPTTLLLVEGVAKGGDLGVNWGDGYITDYDVIRNKGLTDPNPFFNALMGKDYLKNVALTPHMYPPTITKNTNVSSVSAHNASYCC